MPGFTVVAGDVLLVDQDGNPILSVDDAGNFRLAVEAAIKPGSSIGITPAAQPVQTAFVDFLKNGGSEDLVVDGSVTPVAFEVLADPDDDIVLSELRLVMVAGSLAWGNFGKAGGLLPNGVKIEVQLDGALTPTELTAISRNEDFLRLQTPFTEFGLVADAIVGSFGFGGVGRLVAGSSDFVRVTIQDDLTVGSRDVEYFTATLYGNRETPV